MTVEETAAVTDRAMPEGRAAAGPGDGPAGAAGVPLFEIWRQRIQQCFASEGATP